MNHGQDNHAPHPSNLVRTRLSPLSSHFCSTTTGGSFPLREITSHFVCTITRDGKVPRGGRAGERERWREKARGRGAYGLEMHEARRRPAIIEKYAAEKGSGRRKGPAGITAQWARRRIRRRRTRRD